MDSLFFSNLVELNELDKLEKMYKNSVETLQGWFWKLFINSRSGFKIS